MLCYLDSGVLLSPLLKNQDAAVLDACVGWMKRAQRGEVLACTSWLTWDEVTYLAGRTTGARSYDPSFAARAGEVLLGIEGLTFLPVDRAVIRKAQELLRTSFLHPRDSIHVSSALLAQVGTLVTLDGDFERERPMLEAAGIQVHRISVPA